MYIVLQSFGVSEVFFFFLGKVYIKYSSSTCLNNQHQMKSCLTKISNDDELMVVGLVITKLDEINFWEGGVGVNSFDFFALCLLT